MHPRAARTANFEIVFACKLPSISLGKNRTNYVFFAISQRLSRVDAGGRGSFQIGQTAKARSGYRVQSLREDMAASAIHRKEFTSYSVARKCSIG